MSTEAFLEFLTILMGQDIGCYLSILTKSGQKYADFFQNMLVSHRYADFFQNHAKGKYQLTRYETTKWILEMLDCF